LVEMLKPFEGNCPKAVNKDAKYVVRSVDGTAQVGVTYVTPHEEIWHPTTDAHPDLVEAVNAVKTAVNGSPNGPFYINEFGQVIVPVSTGKYFLAMEAYDLPLRFEFEGHIISGDALDLNGGALQPGDLWTGPHPGIPYVLKPGGEDIYYRSYPRPQVEVRVSLKRAVGDSVARALAERIQRVKGWKGGRFYVNEWWEVFAPIHEGSTLEYRYVGHLDESDRNNWFPKV
jgi:hypothetical protein